MKLGPWLLQVEALVASAWVEAEGLVAFFILRQVFL